MQEVCIRRSKGMGSSMVKRDIKKGGRKGRVGKGKKRRGRVRLTMEGL